MKSITQQAISGFMEAAISILRIDDVLGTNMLKSPTRYKSNSKALAQNDNSAQISLQDNFSAPLGSRSTST